jgi:hypothetical protein
MVLVAMHAAYTDLSNFSRFWAACECQKMLGFIVQRKLRRRMRLATAERILALVSLGE